MDGKWVFVYQHHQSGLAPRVSPPVSFIRGGRQGGDTAHSTTWWQEIDARAVPL